MNRTIPFADVRPAMRPGRPQGLSARRDIATRVINAQTAGVNLRLEGPHGRLSMLPLVFGTSQ